MLQLSPFSLLHSLRMSGEKPTRGTNKGNLLIAVGQGCSEHSKDNRGANRAKQLLAMATESTLLLSFHQNTDTGRSWVFTRVCETPRTNSTSPQACRVPRPRHDPCGSSRDSWRPKRGKREGKTESWEQKEGRGQITLGNALFLCEAETEINLGTLLVTVKPTKKPGILLRPEINK